MRRDPREPERPALGERVTLRTGRLVTLALAAATLVLVAAILLGRT